MKRVMIFLFYFLIFTNLLPASVRTVVFMQKETTPGQDIFVKGGHDAALVPATYSSMSEPITYVNTKNATTATIKANDSSLDWGTESALDWTCNLWPSDWGSKKTYAVNGFGEDPENSWGAHWWKFDVLMNGNSGDWYEFKAFMRENSNEWWEDNVNQLGTPIRTINHWGKKGYITRCGYNASWVEFLPLGIPNQAPTASFSMAPESGSVSTTFAADGSASSDPEDGNNLQYRWDWDNDGIYDTTFSAGKTASHSYTTSGIKVIKLQVKDAGGLTAVATKEVVVTQSGGTSSYSSVCMTGDFNSWNPEDTVGTLVNTAGTYWETTLNLNAGTINYKFTANGSWSVNWGSENEATTLPQNGNAVLSAGNITATLVATGPYKITFDDQSRAWSLTWAGGNLSPVASAGRDVSVLKGTSVLFNAGDSYDPDGSIVSYTWDNDLSGASPSMTYNTTGVYNVVLTVKDNDGATSTDSVKITVLNELPVAKTDFRSETIYFVMTARFYDGDPANNVHCWDDAKAQNPDSDPAWRGDFKGLIDKLDYIKALGFSAIWITPVVKNSSGYDYHGYHAINHKQVDPRLESAGTTYQDLINAAHAKGMKIVQDIVINHTGNFGEENLYPLFKRNAPTGLTENIADALTKTDPNNLLPADYDALTPGEQYGARILAMKEDSKDTTHLYHHEKSLSWESYTVQTGQIAGDCVDLNTENPTTANYLIDAYTHYINMGVDAFRVDTVKHVSRLSFNNYYIPAFKAAGGDKFFIFGEVASRYRQVWNSGIPAISCPFFSWKESKIYPWGTREQNENSVFLNWDDNDTTYGQPSSGNHYLWGNNYHAPDTSTASGLSLIDFPMHWNFANAYDAWNVALGGDNNYQDATWNVTYIDSHDYAPDCAPENQRFALGQDVWAENLSLIFLFRGIPCIYYGSEIEFKKGKPIDVGPNAPLEDTGRAYFGNHITGSVNVTDFGQYNNATGNMAATLNYPLAQHIRRLNLIRRACPALQKGQYSTQDISGGMAFKRRYTDDSVDSFVLVTISGGATFNSIPNGTYVDAVTGDSRVVTNGSLSIGLYGKGNVRVYILNGPGKIGTSGSYIK